MPENLYGDDDGSETSAPMTENSPKEETGEQKTALIDAAICPGMEPGDEFVVKVDKVLEKQYLVSYTPEPESEDEGETETETETAPPAEASPAMAGLME